MELVYTPVLGTGGATHASSSLAHGTSKKNMYKKIIVLPKKSNQRIDKFLAKEFFLFSRGFLIKKIKDGSILLNNKIAKPSQILEINDEITLNQNFNIKEELIANKNIDLDIVFKNDDFLIINKPAGIQIHPDKKETSNTISNGLIAKYPEIKNVYDDSKDSFLRPGIVHRLDKETSGLLIIAKNKNSFVELKMAFKKRLVEKKYIALVFGILKNKSGCINKPLAKSSDYRKQIIAKKNTHTKIREAITNYKVIKEFNSFSLVEIFPKTGRMHQIRVHFYSIGHPVIGDKLYSFPEKKLDAKRHLLHAKSIDFTLFGKKYNYLTEDPLDFIDFIEKQN